MYVLQPLLNHSVELIGTQHQGESETKYIRDFSGNAADGDDDEDEGATVPTQARRAAPQARLQDPNPGHRDPAENVRPFPSSLCRMPN